MQNATNRLRTTYEQHPNYAPDAFLDALIANKNLKNDAALSRALNIAPPVISKIRSGKLPVNNNTLVRIHDVFQMPINELRKMMGVQL